MGIEPTSEAWEASILPLYDARSFQLPRLYLINVPCEKLLPRAGDQSQLHAAVRCKISGRPPRRSYPHRTKLESIHPRLN